VEVDKAIYGMLQSSLLFYKKLTKDLIKQGFIINPYDPCVANKMVKDKQLTVTWHVDDLKVSCNIPEEVDNFIQWIRNEYEDFTKVKPSRGKVHDYLAMTLDFTEAGKVKIKMENYVKKMYEEFPYQEELGNKKASTPASATLFKVNIDCDKLNKGKAEVFHTWVAKALFLSKRSRLDIILTVAFLCTRVKGSDEDDWKKLIRLILYLRSTKNLYLTLEATNLSIVRWWADAAFAVHSDMKSHTGGAMTLGKGMIQCISQKQKLNTLSSTEAELVGANDVLSHLLWTKNFMEAQGYKAEQTILNQDNTSAILLEKNGRESSGKNSRHINIRFFFIKDRIMNGNLEVNYCPTDDMVADYMTKPLQGAKFYRFRKIIMNL